MQGGNKEGGHMKRAVVIGGGISGLSCATMLAEEGVYVLLVSPYPSERSQSVMAAGGINAVFDPCSQGDSISCHIEDTLRGGRFIAGTESVTGLCREAESIIRYLERLGTVFTTDDDNKPLRRAFGGQSFRRTCFCGTSTGKQIVSGLVMDARRLESAGLIERRPWVFFHSALIKDGVCYGALLFDERGGSLLAEYADAVIVATGGQNALFGKTTGSTQCDGYAVGRLFQQGVELKNLEFIQYHPTTLETSQKKMLISEAARGEGGRLFYIKNGERVYFMEAAFGDKGNLMTRDVTSRQMVNTGEEIFLDISFLPDRLIKSRLHEVWLLCEKYRGIDVTKEPIPVSPSVHFFMGGIAVHNNHETNIQNLFAIGECASIYHGANRLGGNSLLAAVYSGRLAAKEVAGRESVREKPDFAGFISDEKNRMDRIISEKSPFPVMYIRDLLSETMNKSMGIIRERASLEDGINDVEYYISIAERLRYDSSVSRYANYTLGAMLTLAKAMLSCAVERMESRGAHYRADYPGESQDYRAATIVSYQDGDHAVRFDKECAYES